MSTVEIHERRMDTADLSTLFRARILVVERGQWGEEGYVSGQQKAHVSAGGHSDALDSGRKLRNGTEWR